MGSPGLTFPDLRTSGGRDLQSVCKASVCAPGATFHGSRPPVLNYSRLSSALLHGTTLEIHLEASAGPKCGTERSL